MSESEKNKPCEPSRCAACKRRDSCPAARMIAALNIIEAIEHEEKNENEVSPQQQVSAVSESTQ